MVSPTFAIELGRLGGLGVLNGEGLIGRHADVEAKVAQVLDAARSDEDPAAAIRLLQQFHAGAAGTPICSVRRSAASATPGHDRCPRQSAERPGIDARLVSAGIDLLVIQGTIISGRAGRSNGEPLNLKTFISEIDIPVVAGGVADHRTALHLMRTGAAGVIIGYGSISG